MCYLVRKHTGFTGQQVYNVVAVKNIRVVVVLLSLVFLFPRVASAATVLNNSLNVQTQTNLRIAATPTPTPAVLRVITTGSVIVTPTPTVSRVVAPVKLSTSAMTVPIFARVMSPNGGENITIGDTQSDVLFKYGGNFDMSVGGSYGYRLELWRNGQLLGNVDNFDQYPLNPNQSSVTFSWKPGQYFQKNPEYGTESLKTADAGTGYSLRVVLSLAYADPDTGVTKYKDIAEDISDHSFTFLPKPKTLKVYQPEHYSVTMKYPNGGELLPLGERVDVVFDYAGTFDEENGGTYHYRIELWQNGKRLGNILTLQEYQLDIHHTQVTYGLVPENYWNEGDNTTITTKITTQESGIS